MFEKNQWRRSSVFIVNFEHISPLVLVFLLLTLNMSFNMKPPTRKTVTQLIPTGQLPPGKLPPGQFLPAEFPPRITSTWKIPTQLIATPNNCHPADLTKFVLILFAWTLFGGSNSLGLPIWTLIFLSANEKCCLLLTTSQKIFQKDFIVNRSGCLVFVRYLEVSSISSVQCWEGLL